MRQQQLTRDDFDGGPVSLNEIIDGLYLGKTIIYPQCFPIFM